jgi:hypothetical protein
MGMEILRRRAASVVRAPARAASREEHLLPPRVPEELDELQEAATLLGAYIQAINAKGRMRESRLLRLRELIGVVPTPEDAGPWKAGLKELRQELAELEKKRAGRRG